MTLLGLCVPFFLTSSSLAKDIVDYPFSKDIITSNIDTEVEVAFDAETLGHLNQKARNFALFDQENNLVPFDFFIQESGRIKDLEVIEVSSQKTEEERLDFIIDNNSLTSFHFDLQDGKKENPAEILIDFKEPRVITRVNIFDSAGPRAKEVMIRGGISQRNMKTILSQRPYEPQYDVQSVPVRFLKVYLWGSGIVIDDIRVFGFMDVSAYFTPEKEKKYTLMYGDKKNKTITYKKQIQEKKEAKQVLLGGQEWNERYPEDVDNDGIQNSFDNCFLISNSSQKDSDDDGVGDKCDNAPNIKNISQDDVDFDGVGDIIDNCKLEYNHEQEDLDNDGIGDICDLSFTEQEGEVSPVSYTIFAMVLIVVVSITQVNRIRKKALGSNKEKKK